MKKNDETYLVQCKQWKTQLLGVQAVRELYGVMAANNAVGGFVVCAGKFTDEAKSFAENINIWLFDGAMLHRMIRDAHAPLSQSVAAPVAAQAVGRSQIAPSAVQTWFDVWPGIVARGIVARERVVARVGPSQHSVMFENKDVIGIISSLRSVFIRAKRGR